MALVRSSAYAIAFDMELPRALRRLRVDLAVFWAWAALTPFIATLARRLPPFPATWDRRWAVAIGVHLATCLALAVAHGWWFVQAPLVVGGNPVGFGARTAIFFHLDTNVVLYGLIVGVVLLREQGWAARARAVESVRLATELSRARLEVLLLQLQPHFLFNTLHLVAELVHRADGSARRVLVSLRELLLASTARAHDRQVVTLAEELEQLDSYLAIQRARFGERLVFSRDVPQELLAAPVPFLVLQPLVENAVRHGLERHERPGSVEIRARRVGGDAPMLELVVRDNGRGLAEGRGAHAEGFGLRNTRSRLRALHGSRASLALRPAEGGGAEAVLVLPLSPAVEEARAGRDASDEDDAASLSPSLLALLAPEPPPLRALVPRRLVPITFAVWLIVGVIWGFQVRALRPPAPDAVTLAQAIVQWVPQALLWWIPSLVVVAFARRWPLSGAIGVRAQAVRVVAHVVAALAFAFALGALRSALGMSPTLAQAPGPVATTWFWDVLAIAGVVTLVTVFEGRRRLRERELALAELHASLEETRLDAVTWRVQPALVVAALDAIAETSSRDAERADAMTIRLAEWLRRVLRTQDASAWPVSREADALRAFLAVIEDVHAPSLATRVRVERSAEELVVPPLLAQHLVEVLVAGEGARTARALDVALTASEGRLDLLLRTTYSEAALGFANPAAIDGVAFEAIRARLRHLHDEPPVLVADGDERTRTLRLSIPARHLAAEPVEELSADPHEADPATSPPDPAVLR